jgi:hypothetical protein
MNKSQTCKDCDSDSCKGCVFRRWVNPSWYESLMLYTVVPILVGAIAFIAMVYLVKLFH